MDAALTSSDRHDWETPELVLDLVRKIGPITFDPCTHADNPVKAALFYTEADNGLKANWPTLGLAYVNPPYGRDLPSWVGRCAREGWLIGDGKSQLSIVLLTPNRPDTRWYDVLERESQAYCEVRGRLRFRGAKDSAPFPSALHYWGSNPYKFCDIFQSLGRVGTLP